MRRPYLASKPLPSSISSHTSPSWQGVAKRASLQDSRRPGGPTVRMLFRSPRDSVLPAMARRTLQPLQRGITGSPFMPALTKLATKTAVTVPTRAVNAAATATLGYGGKLASSQLLCCPLRPRPNAYFLSPKTCLVSSKPVSCLMPSALGFCWRTTNENRITCSLLGHCCTADYIDFDSLTRACKYFINYIFFCSKN